MAAASCLQTHLTVPRTGTFVLVFVMNNVLILHVQQLEQLLMAVQRCVIETLVEHVDLWSECGGAVGHTPPDLQVGLFLSISVSYLAAPSHTHTHIVRQPTTSSGPRGQIASQLRQYFPLSPHAEDKEQIIQPETSSSARRV